MAISKDQLHVITVISNPVRYQTRYNLFKQFEKHMQESGVNLWVVELAFGDREYTVTDSANPRHIQLRTEEELWHKENMINIAISKLPQDWKYVAWIDADIHFVRKDWVEETIHQLQHYQVVQLFQTAVDLGPDGHAFQIHKGFCWSYLKGDQTGKYKFGPYGYQTGHYPFWHPGYAWAATRFAIDKLGGLIDKAILGAGDHHMALALIGRAKNSVPANMHPNYMHDIMRWQERATEHIKKDIGYVEGSILHFWHGKKKDRRYVERWEILTKHQYDPYTDLKRDWQGIYQLMDNRVALRDDVRKYFRQRNEDSVDFE